MLFLRRLAIPFRSLFCLTLAAQVSCQPSATEQRIQRIQEHVLPAIVVEGQTKEFTLPDRMAELHVPGVSIAVIHDGSIEWARGFGVTSIGGPPVTTKTLFQAASISKTVSAFAALQLVGSGKVSLDTDVNEYLTTWKVPENEFTSKSKVTLRGLLTHTAGLTVDGFPGYESNALIPTTVQILNGQPPANNSQIFVDAIPGTISRYSGGGYVIVQQLLEDVTRTPFAKLMRDSVLTPIGMAHSTFEQPLSPVRMTEAAIPYRAGGQPVPGGPHVYPEMAPAGLWSTPSDLARFVIEVQHALIGKSTILSSAMARAMLTPGANRQGLGPQTDGSKDRPYFFHDGGSDGYRSIFVAYNTGDGAVVMTNGENGDELASDIIRTIAYEYKWPNLQPDFRKVSKVDLRIFDNYVGAYRFGSDPTSAAADVVTITRDGDRFFAQPTGKSRAEMIPTATREFFVKDVNALIKFETDVQGKVIRLILTQDGTNTATRVPHAEEMKIVEAQAASNRRIADGKPDSRTEAVLRRLIDEILRGQLDYRQISSPAFASAVRQQLPNFVSLFMNLGALQSVSFKAVKPGGEDVYEAKFATGTLEFQILLTPDGKIEKFDFDPL